MDDKPVFLNSDKVTLLEVIEQVEKDLQMSGNAYQFHETTPLSLIQELSSVLEKVEQQNKLSGLIYRIDINMDQLKTENFYQDLSQTIWNRCFQKVWFRKNWDK